MPLMELEKVTHSPEQDLKKAKYFKVSKDKEFLLVYWTHYHLVAERINFSSFNAFGHFEAILYSILIRSFY